MGEGFVFSDLHMFAHRSDAARLQAQIEQAVRKAKMVVLNGDIFDFKWSKFSSIAESVEEALLWLQKLCALNSNCTFYYLLGNHDAHPLFVKALAELCKVVPNLKYEEFHLVLGKNLFLHGDVCDLKENESLEQHRQKFNPDRPLGPFSNLLYAIFMKLGLHKLVFLIHTKKALAQKIIAYTARDQKLSQLNIENIYFGHTHIPMSNYKFNQFKFFNTGSAIRGLRFAALDFEL